MLLTLPTPEHPHSCSNQKCLQILSNVSRQGLKRKGGNIIQFENHCSGLLITILPKCQFPFLPTPSNMLRFTVTGVIFWEVSSERMEPVQPCQCPPHGQRGQTVWACPVTKSCPTLVTQWDFPAGLLCPWDFPGKNTGEGCHFLLEGICPT